MLNQLAVSRFDNLVNSAEDTVNTIANSGSHCVKQIDFSVKSKIKSESSLAANETKSSVTVPAQDSHTHYDFVGVAG